MTADNSVLSFNELEELAVCSYLFFMISCYEILIIADTVKLLAPISEGIGSNNQ